MESVELAEEQRRLNILGREIAAGHAAAQEFKQEREREVAQRDEERTKVDAERRRVAREKLVEEVRASFFIDPAATEADFQRAKESLIDETLKRRAAALDDQARRASERRYRSRF